MGKMEELLALVHQPNPTDPSRWDIAPGKHKAFSALCARLAALPSGDEQGAFAEQRFDGKVEVPSYTTNGTASPTKAGEVTEAMVERRTIERCAQVADAYAKAALAVYEGDAAAAGREIAATIRALSLPDEEAGRPTKDDTNAE